MFFLKLYKFLFANIYKFKRILRIFFRIDQVIKIDRRKIILPPGHVLSWYNNIYKDYDKFLPNIIRNIKPKGSIIDVGANIGDTLWRLINANEELDYYCIEGDDYFFKYLTKNKELLDMKLKKKVFLIKELVGDNLSGNLRETSGESKFTGTKSLVESEIGLKSKTLDDIITNNKIENIKLIKVDVDGYDHNVLFSGMNTIKKYKPDLFFEYMDIRKDGYNILIRDLVNINYSSWTVLDNYGSTLFKNKHHSSVLDLINSNKKNNIIDIYCKIN
jgi:FkbM family methyltransferase